MLTLSELARLANDHMAELSARVREFSIGATHFAFDSKPAIMGVINLSGDSWYRESVCLSTAAAVQRGQVLHAQGADLIDIGAESTLSHAARLDEGQQQSLLLPVVRELSGAGLLVSVETYLADVARAALEHGARVVNLTGTAEAESIYRLAAEHDAAAIVCYVQGTHARDVGDFRLEADPIPAMRDYFRQQIDLASACGLEKLILDPGLGFYYDNLRDSAVRVRHQISSFLNTFRLRALGFPMCQALPHAFEYFGEEVRCAEPFFAVLAALGRTDLFRTHEVAKVKAVLETLAVVGPAAEKHR